MLDDNTVLLITGAINVVAPNTILNDSKLRTTLYVNSILNWVSQTSIQKIVFCENTHSIPIELKKSLSYIGFVLNKDIELLTFQGDELSIKKYGKGYGEGEIIKYALENSSLLKNSVAFFKLTGKFFIKNFDKIKISTQNKNCFLLQSTKFRNNKQIDTRFYYVNKEFYMQYLLDSYKLVNESEYIYLEHVLYSELLKHKHEISSFIHYPKLEGFSGSMGSKTEYHGLLYFKRNILLKIGQYSI